MALVAPAKQSLWVALRALRSVRPRAIEQPAYDKIKKGIEDALVLLEMTPAMIDPGATFK